MKRRITVFNMGLISRYVRIETSHAGAGSVPVPEPAFDALDFAGGEGAGVPR